MITLQLDLRENGRQFGLLVLVSVFVGSLVGLGRRKLAQTPGQSAGGPYKLPAHNLNKWTGLVDENRIKP